MRNVDIVSNRPEGRRKSALVINQTTRRLIEKISQNFHEKDRGAVD